MGKMYKKLSHDLEVSLKIIGDLGVSLDTNSVILDYGCGSGRFVKELNELGYNAFGCDIKIDSEQNDLLNTGLIRPIDLDPYRLPFEDNTFDFIYSFSVFEHVQNYAESISELARVLKPNGICYHFFPARYRVIEPHTFVPLSTVIRSYNWLYLWSLMRIRNEFQEGMSAKEIAAKNQKYLRNHTNYLSRHKLNEYFKKHFDNVIFGEKYFLKYLNRANYLHSLSGAIPFIPHIYGSFRSNIIITRIPKSVNEPPKL
jgi:SAM-dependent methyltransferase